MGLTHGGAVFSVARERGWRWQEILDFSASINPLGPAPGVRDAIIGAIERITCYPDRYCSRLQQALAEEWRIAPEQILLGNGATELIHFLARVWPVEATLVTPVFSEFHRAYPRARLLKQGDEWPDVGLVVVTNPVNPTGAAARVPSRVQPRRGPTLVDESFLEFSNLATRMHDGCIVLRSLTKFHALPGLRIGALVGPADFMRELRRKREPWQVNVLAEAAGLAALRDKDHQRATVEYVRSEQTRLRAVFRNLPEVELYPTNANFYFASLRYDAASLCSYMLENRLLLRNCAAWPGIEGEAVRFAIRTREENDRLFDLWRDFLCD